MNKKNNENVQKNIPSNYLKRILATLIDLVILWIFGIMLGSVFSNIFILLGWKGKFIGFAITLLYLSVFNSYVFNGQTIGQTLVKIKVVNKNGESLSGSKSTIRSLVLSVIILLNKWMLPVNKNSIFLIIVEFVLISIILLELYFFLFSGKSKQLFHDVIVNSYVISIDGNKEELKLPEMNKKVLLCSFSAEIVVLLIILLMTNLSKKSSINELIEIQRDLQENYNLQNVSVYSGSTKFITLNNEVKSGKYLRVSCMKDSESMSNEDIEEKAISVLKRYSIPDEVDFVELNYFTGYDIGIASKWRTSSKRYSNTEYLDLIREKSK